MKFALFILLTIPAYCVETIICQGINDSYDCYVHSAEEPLLENVIHVTEADSSGYVDDEEEDTEIAKESYTPLIFPNKPVWW